MKVVGRKTVPYGWLQRMGNFLGGKELVEKWIGANSRPTVLQVLQFVERDIPEMDDITAVEVSKWSQWMLSQILPTELHTAWTDELGALTRTFKATYADYNTAWFAEYCRQAAMVDVKYAALHVAA